MAKTTYTTSPSCKTGELLRVCVSQTQANQHTHTHTHSCFGVVVREQLMFPLQFVGALGRFDLECSVSGGGRSSQVGALRLAISRALLSFLSEGEVETMRQGGHV